MRFVPELKSPVQIEELPESIGSGRGTLFSELVAHICLFKTINDLGRHGRRNAIRLSRSLTEFLKPSTKNEVSSSRTLYTHFERPVSNCGT